jgi:hypothetical protein
MLPVDEESTVTSWYIPIAPASFRPHDPVLVSKGVVTVFERAAAKNTPLSGTGQHAVGVVSVTIHVMMGLLGVTFPFIEPAALDLRRSA